MATSFYDTLGVTKSASQDDIKKAFRALAHKHHPDKTGGDDKKFKELSEAYSVLGDEKKRKEYDTYGQSFNGAGPQGGAYTGYQQSGFGGFEGFDFSGFQQGQGQQFEFNMGDMFGDFFGGGQRAPQKARGRDVQIDLDLTFVESVFGADREVLVNKVNTCKECEGTGAKGKAVHDCATCNGAGSVKEMRRTILGTMQSVKECGTCFGTGKVPKEKCTACKGARVVKQQDSIKIGVPAGMSDGETLRMRGRGEAAPGGEYGDLYIRISVKKDVRFVRDGSDIVHQLNIKVTDALLGSVYTVPTVDGTATVTVPAGITDSEEIILKGQGFPGRGGRGNMRVVVAIEIPKKLSKVAKDLILKLKEEGV
jgi:molecular chaperone DnaJ